MGIILAVLFIIAMVIIGNGIDNDSLTEAFIGLAVCVVCIVRLVIICID